MKIKRLQRTGRTQITLMFVFHNRGGMRLPTVVASLLAAAISPACAESLNFDHSAPGSLPAGWSVAMTHQGGPPKWEILEDSSAPSKRNVLAQVSNDRTAGRFPLAVWNGSTVKDGALSVKFKAISGVVDQGAGLVWRYRDPNNYYIVRANALEDNVVLYKVQNGERVSLAPKGAVSNAYGVKHKVPRQTWTTLRVDFHGELFSVSLNGEKLFDVEDSTFMGTGKTGLWTKSDSVIYFDDFQVSEEGKK
jgi:hypothetical protein